MASGEKEENLRPFNEWVVFSNELNLTLNFLDFSDVYLAERSGFKPGFYVKIHPVRGDDLLDRAFMEKLEDSLADAITDWICGTGEEEIKEPVDFQINPDSDDLYLIDLEKYSKEEAVANFRVYQVSSEEFEKEAGDPNFLLPAKNDLPL